MRETERERGERERERGEGEIQRVKMEEKVQQNIMML